MTDSPESTTTTTQVLDLLRRLNRGGKYAYLWRSKTKASTWYAVDGDGPVVPAEGASDVYWSVHPTDAIPETNRKGEKASPRYVRAQKEHVSAINCLFAEFDVEGFGTKEHILTHIESLALSPNIVIDSGHGFHCYWMLSDTELIADALMRSRADRRQKAWVALMDSDPNAKDLARVLRVPGTWNAKDPKAKVPVLLVKDDGGSYDVEALEVLLPDGWDDEAIPRATVDAKALDANDAIGYLKNLDPERALDHNKWVGVGMALHWLGENGLVLWDTWSQEHGGRKYHAGECAQRWETFRDDPAGITLASLRHWSTEDNPDATALLVPKALATGKMNVSHYLKALEAMGYSFSIDTSDWSVIANGVMLTDPLERAINYRLHSHNYKDARSVKLAVHGSAYEHQFHPVRDYLQALEWDGKDHITNLAGYFTDEYNLMPIMLRRWLVGASRRVLHDGERNRVLVLDGRQSLGKSYFARWLASPIPGRHYEGPITTDDKDSLVRLMRMWVWEVAELGSTVRKSDRDALKSFLSLQHVTVRKAYGMGDTQGVAMASFIATVNDEAGFLVDPTGSDRFMCTTITDIVWTYTEQVDVNQVWAQAMALVKAGETGVPTAAELARINAANDEYEPGDSVVDSAVMEQFEFQDPSTVAGRGNRGTDEAWFTSAVDVQRTIQAAVGLSPSRETQWRIAASVRRMGGAHRMGRAGGRVVKGWRGVRPRVGAPRVDEVDADALGGES